MRGYEAAAESLACAHRIEATDALEMLAHHADAQLEQPLDVLVARRREDDQPRHGSAPGGRRRPATSAIAIIASTIAIAVTDTAAASGVSPPSCSE